VETYSTSGNLDYLDSIPEGLHDTMGSKQEHDFGLQKKIRNPMSSDSASTNKLKIRACTGENVLSLADATMLPVKSAADDLNLMKIGQVNSFGSSTY
ncbi:hypothetical protein Tco_0055364, partial [Tanacetum coccineum]